MPPGGTVGRREKAVSNSDLNEKKENQAGFLARLRESSFPAAAVVGAFASFAGTAFARKDGASEKEPPAASPVQISFSENKKGGVVPRLEFEYSPVFVLGSAGSRQSFLRSVSAVAVGPADRIYVLGDGDVHIFDSDGKVVRSFRAPEGAICMAVGADERIYFGITGHLEIYSASGAREGGFVVGDNGKPSAVTAIKRSRSEIIVADASSRCIRRYTETGKQIGIIGTQNKTHGFMLPNRFLDLDMDANGIIRATDTGRHRVSSWNLDGTPAGYFGKFGLKNPEDFVGCCNPVNIAIAPDAKIVTAEKVIARVKVFDPSGKLLAMIGPEHFDPRCTHLHLAVDSKGRILVADPVRLEVKVFSGKNQLGGLEQA
jgi:hypothetical protein